MHQVAFENSSELFKMHKFVCVCVAFKIRNMNKVGIYMPNLLERFGPFFLKRSFKQVLLVIFPFDVYVVSRYVVNAGKTTADLTTHNFSLKTKTDLLNFSECMGLLYENMVLKSFLLNTE